MPKIVCKICNIRKPKRHCPALPGDICPICCAEEREVTLDCPLTCPHLQDAYQYERLPDLQVADVPYRNVRITAEFLDSHDFLNIFLSKLVLRAATLIRDVLDRHVREALDILIQDYMGRQTDVIPETPPYDEVSAIIGMVLREGIAQGRAAMDSEVGRDLFRDETVRDMLISLRRAAFQEDNGRPLGRMFIASLDSQFPELPEPSDIE